MSKFQTFSKDKLPEADKHKAEIVYHKFMIHYYECPECLKLALKGRLCSEGEGLYTAYKNMLALEKGTEDDDSN